MPSAYDSHPLKITHDPNQRIDSYAGKLPPLDPLALIQQTIEFFEKFGFDAIRNLTGIDLSSPEAFLGSVAAAITAGGAAVVALVQALLQPLFAVIKSVTGVDLSTVFQGLDLSNPGSILTSIVNLGGNLIQQVIDALVSGLTGGNSVGNNPATVALTLLNQVLQFPGHVLEQIFGSLAALQAQVNGVQNQVTALTDDFTTATAAGYTNIVGTLAVSTRGKYIQTPALSMGYRNTGPASDKHGGQIVIDGLMRGTCGLAICSDTTASNYAALHVVSGFDGDCVRLVTGSSPTVWVVQKQQDFLTPKLQNTNAFDIWYDPTPNTFHVLRNNVEIFTWVDTGNLVTHSSTKRRVAPISNGNNVPLDGSWGPGIKRVTVYDK